MTTFCKSMIFLKETALRLSALNTVFCSQRNFMQEREKKTFINDNKNNSYH